ncbi:MAG: hypothetical protein AAF959_07075 [Cyanobacteria bacterium P01_D01_bin.56]
MASNDSGKGLVESLYIKFLSTDTSWTSSIYAKVLGGTVLGGLLVLIPVLYAGVDSVEQLSSVQLCLILLVMQACIILTVKLGDKFADAIAKGLDNSGF